MRFIAGIGVTLVVIQIIGMLLGIESDYAIRIGIFICVIALVGLDEIKKMINDR